MKKSKYTVENIRLLKSYEPYDFEFFWGHHPSKDGRITNTCFSQWWGCSFEEKGIVFNNAEKYMMYHKALVFDDLVIAEEILKARNPKVIKDLGREVRGFDKYVWEEYREDVVISGNLLKFSQNPKLKDFLLSTGDKILVEASPYDNIWGIKLGVSDDRIFDVSKWRGLNLLGFCLMDVRDVLRGEVASYEV